MLNNDPNGPVRTVSVSTGDAYANVAEQAVRNLYPGRLARERSPDAQPGTALRPGDRRRVRSVAEPQFREDPGGRPRRAAGRHHRPRKLRPRSADRTATTSSRASAPSTTCAATAATSSAAAGASTPISGIPTRTSCSPRKTPTAPGFGNVFNVDVPSGIRNAGRQLLPGRPAAGQHRQPESGDRRQSAAGTVGGSASATAATAADQCRLVARADVRHGGQPRLRQFARPRPELSAAIEHADSRHDDPPGLGAAALAAEPGHQREPSRRSAVAAAITTR